MKQKPLLCRIGLHWPMRGHEPDFQDVVSGEIVCLAACPCGKVWMVAGFTRLPLFKMEAGRPLGGYEAWLAASKSGEGE